MDADGQSGCGEEAWAGPERVQLLRGLRFSLSERTTRNIFKDDSALKRRRCQEDT